jgi:hypothetical protein
LVNCCNSNLINIFGYIDFRLTMFDHEFSKPMSDFDAIQMFSRLDKNVWYLIVDISLKKWNPWDREERIKHWSSLKLIAPFFHYILTHETFINPRLNLFFPFIAYEINESLRRVPNPPMSFIEEQWKCKSDKPWCVYGKYTHWLFQLCLHHNRMSLTYNREKTLTREKKKRKKDQETLDKLIISIPLLDASIPILEAKIAEEKMITAQFIELVFPIPKPIEKPSVKRARKRKQATK